MKKQPYLDKLFIGKPKTVGDADALVPLDKEWTSGIFKQPVHQPIWLGTTNLEGDGQADLKNHGGPEKAVMAYSLSHYALWQQELANYLIQPGAMGENFSVANMDENGVCIGDIYEIGDAIIQVSQPRQPCWKPARRFKMIDFALRIQKSGRTGWYFRVLKEGWVKEQTPLMMIDRPCPEWTISRCNDVMHEHTADLKAAAELTACEYLSDSWKQTLTHRIEKGQKSNVSKRVYGPNLE